MTSTKYIFPQLTSLAKSLDPFTIGFEDVISQIGKVQSNMSKSIPGFPPYNIKQIKDNKYVIEMAVAGFAKTDIEITLDGDKLIIKGNSKDTEPTEISAFEYIHKGIANRNFERTFTLADSVEIKDAEIVNGMLNIWLENMVKVQDAIKKINIKENKND